MYTIKIPLIEQHLYVYVGEKEKSKYENILNDGRLDKDRFHIGSSLGSTAGNNIWIKDGNDPATIIHELQHFATNIMDHLISDGHKEEEFQAYIMEYTTVAVLRKQGLLKDRKEVSRND